MRDFKVPKILTHWLQQKKSHSIKTKKPWQLIHQRLKLNSTKKLYILPLLWTNALLFLYCLLCFALSCLCCISTAKSLIRTVRNIKLIQSGQLNSINVEKKPRHFHRRPHQNLLDSAKVALSHTHTHTQMVYIVSLWKAFTLPGSSEMSGKTSGLVDLHQQARWSTFLQIPFSCARMRNAKIPLPAVFSPDASAWHSFGSHTNCVEGGAGLWFATSSPHNVGRSSHGNTSTQRRAGRWWARSTQRRCRSFRWGSDSQTKPEEPEANKRTNRGFTALRRARVCEKQRSAISYLSHHSHKGPKSEHL